MSSRIPAPRTHIRIVTSPDPEHGHGVRRRRLLARLALAAGFAGGLLTGWVALPRYLYGRSEQPLVFNHAVHTVDGGMACEDCHGFGADGDFAGLPTVSVCRSCHTEALGDTDAERALIADYVVPDREIPWRAYSRQPDNVYFSHAPHVLRAAIECRRCHGDRGQSTTTPVYEFNRLSTYSRNIWGPRISGGGPEIWDSMKMSACCRCHAASDVRDHCLMCHK